MKRLAVLFSFVFIFLISFSQTKSVKKSSPLAEAAPESAGISSERIARIDKMCADAVEEGQVPGIVSLVARNGKIVHWKAYGMADNSVGKQLKRDDIFRIASQTKAITATAVMMLWEEGKFRLDDPVSKFIPEFKNPKVLTSFSYRDTTWNGVAANREITIRHLLTHTSGVGYGVIDGDERFRMIFGKAGITDAFTTEDVVLAENIKKLAKMPLHHHPGEAYTYSEGLDILGYLIEVVSGIPFDKFLKERIFDPLGMKDTYFYLPDDKASRLVTVQQRGENGEWKKVPYSFYDSDYPVKGAKTFFSGGGGLSGTIKDYAIFLQMYLNGGEYNGTRLLSRTTVNTIMGNHSGNLFSGKNSYYGLVFGVITSEGENKGGTGSKGTFDWGGYFNTQYFADPNENIIGIIFKQTEGPTNDQTGWKFRQLVFQSVDD